MKLYELHLVLKPSLNEIELEKMTSDITGLWAKNGFEVTVLKTKEHERLPYPIKHITEGHIVNVEFSGSDEAVFPNETEAALGHNENILRHMILAKSEKMLNKMKPLPAFETRPARPERRPATIIETAPSTEPKPEKPVNLEEVDRKLEELLK